MIPSALPDARGRRKERIGEVLSDKMDKTIVVWVERRLRHPLYQKEIKVGSKCYAHDEKEQAHVGDRVRIVEIRPLSRLKRWRLAGVVSRAKLARPTDLADEEAALGRKEKTAAAPAAAAPPAEAKSKEASPTRRAAKKGSGEGA